MSTNNTFNKIDCTSNGSSVKAKFRCPPASKVEKAAEKYLPQRPFIIQSLSELIHIEMKNSSSFLFL